MTVIELPDEAATAAFATRLARLARRGDVIALKGELGAGTTSFARAFIRALAGRRPGGAAGDHRCRPAMGRPARHARGGVTWRKGAPPFTTTIIGTNARKSAGARWPPFSSHRAGARTRRAYLRAMPHSAAITGSSMASGAPC